MEYGRNAVAGSAAMGGAAALGNMAQTQAIEKARFPQQLDQLQKVLAHCQHAAVGIHVAVDRMIGSIPQDASKSPPAPPSSNIEQRLAELISFAESLANDLHQAQSRLTSAV